MSTQIYPPQDSHDSKAPSHPTAQSRIAHTIFQSAKDSKPPSLPKLRVDAVASDPPQQPPAPPAPAPASAPASKPPSTKPPSMLSSEKHGEHRVLSHSEWIQFCRGVGVLKDDEPDDAPIARPSGGCWPPRGLKDGLYRDVLFQKTKFTYWFHILSSISWCLMLIQIALSAVLTALGSQSEHYKIPITTLAAVNTSIAGILALMHNSGLPDRYRSDRNQFLLVEEQIKEVIDTGIVPADFSISDVLAGCFDLFHEARQTVQSNIPASYTPSASTTKAALRGARKMVTGKK
ncbi:hypothetical protein F4780DRAFT_779429 [Xylariomycetidae sp. FL0641]|nr:hypothetical protein F4780DRAFT_779429 [Xylariomycetidae sp. FL0641]